MDYNNDIVLSEAGYEEGEEVHAYWGPRVIAPAEVAAVSRAITATPMASSSSSASVDRLFSALLSPLMLRRTQDSSKVCCTGRRK